MGCAVMNDKPRKFAFNPRRKGLSLIELLIVVSIIGFITSIGVALVAGRYRDVSERARLRATARNMVMIYDSARALGADVLVPNDLTATLHKVVDGVTITDGVASGKKMSLPHVTDDDILNVQQFLSFNDGEIVFLGGQ